MLKLEISCETTDEARIYLNAKEYLNLITDFSENLRRYLKHDNSAEGAQRLLANFKDDFAACAEVGGPY